MNRFILTFVALSTIVASNAALARTLSLETSHGLPARMTNTETNYGLRFRADLGVLSGNMPTLFGGYGSHYTFLADLVLLNSLLYGVQMTTSVMGFEHAHKMPWDAGIPVVSFGGTNDNSFSWTWRDSNFGSAYFNTVGHPLSFFAMSAYFRDVRGYSENMSFLGGMMMNMLWETMWENIERPVSLHDLMMNTLGALVGSYDTMGLAFGVDPFSPTNTSKYYTEFYYNARGDLRTWLRYYPVENYSDEPLIPWDLGFGMTWKSDSAELSAGFTLLTSADSDRWEPSPRFDVAGRFGF